MKYTVCGMKKDEVYPHNRDLEKVVEITKKVRYSDLVFIIEWTQTRPGVEWIIISWEEEKYEPI